VDKAAISLSPVFLFEIAFTNGFLILLPLDTIGRKLVENSKKMAATANIFILHVDVIISQHHHQMKVNVPSSVMFTSKFPELL